MKLSILTPTLNCRNTIEDTLNSVIELEGKFVGEVEHLIGDSGSSDGTFDLLKEYSSRFSFIKIFEFEGSNIPDTLNCLIECAEGDYLAILNGDDFFLNNFTNALNLILKNNFIGIYCAAIQIASEDSRCLGVRNVSLKDLNNYMSVNHPGMIVHKSVFSTVGKFNSQFPTSYDYCWTWSALKYRVNFKLSNIPITYMRLGGISEKRALIAAKEIFFYKYEYGEKLNALLNLLRFYFKFLFKKISPNFILFRLVKIYRSFNGSIDKY